MCPPAYAPSATRTSAPHFSYILARRPEETIPANGMPASRQTRTTSREMPAPCTTNETPSSIEMRRQVSKSIRLIAAIRFTPTKPPGASARARRISVRSMASLLTTAETVPTPTSRGPRMAATLPARPSEAWIPIAPCTSSRFPERTTSSMARRSSLGARRRSSSIEVMEGEEVVSALLSMGAPERVRRARPSYRAPVTGASWGPGPVHPARPLARRVEPRWFSYPGLNDLAASRYGSGAAALGVLAGRPVWYAVRTTRRANAQQPSWDPDRHAFRAAHTPMDVEPRLQAEAPPPA